LNDENGIAYVPASIDTDETKVKSVDICPILTQYFVYPFTNDVKPMLVVKILHRNVPMLLDTGAHVSVLPKQLIFSTISLPEEGHAKRHVKAFGGEEIVLVGPVLLDIVICGVHIVHPFFYVDAEIPAIGGYDLLRAAHIIIDTQSAEVWSKHPDAVNQSHISENIFATVQSQSLFSMGELSLRRLRRLELLVSRRTQPRVSLWIPGQLFLTPSHTALFPRLPVSLRTHVHPPLRPPHTV